MPDAGADAGSGGLNPDLPPPVTPVGGMAFPAMDGSIPGAEPSAWPVTQAVHQGTAETVKNGSDIAENGAFPLAGNGPDPRGAIPGILDPLSPEDGAVSAGATDTPGTAAQANPGGGADPAQSGFGTLSASGLVPFGKTEMRAAGLAARSAGMPDPSGSSAGEAGADEGSGDPGMIPIPQNVSDIAEIAVSTSGLRPGSTGPHEFPATAGRIPGLSGLGVERSLRGSDADASAGTGAEADLPQPAPLSASLIHGIPPSDQPFGAFDPRMAGAEPMGSASASPDLGSDALSATVTEGGASRGTTSAAADGPARGHGASLQQAIMAQVRVVAGGGSDGPVTLTLSPQELGTLRFEVQQTGQGLHLHLTVDQPATLDLLRRQGEQLLAELRLSGFQDASLSYAGQDGQSGGNAQGEGQRNPDVAPLRPLRDSSLAAQPGTSRPSAGGSLNLRL